MLNKTPLIHQSLGHMSFFLFLSLSFSLFQANFLELRSPMSSLSCWTCKTLTKGCPVPTWSSESPVSRAFLVFCVNQGMSSSFSLLLSYRRLQTTRFWSIKGLQCFPTMLLLIFIEVYFICNVVLISSIHQSDSVIHTYIFIFTLFFAFSSIIGYYKTLGTVAYTVQ